MGGITQPRNGDAKIPCERCARKTDDGEQFRGRATSQTTKATAMMMMMGGGRREAKKRWAAGQGTSFVDKVQGPVSSQSSQSQAKAGSLFVDLSLKTGSTLAAGSWLDARRAMMPNF